MPAQQKLREENRRLREENERLKEELARLSEKHEELNDKHERLREKYYRAKNTAVKRNNWNKELAHHCLVYRKYISDEFGRPPQIETDCAYQTDSATLTFYLRPYAHYAPQILIPGRLYTCDRMCLHCGQLIPQIQAWGKCPRCPRGAYYCSDLCQRAHWPVHKYDHAPDERDHAGEVAFGRPDLTRFDLSRSSIVAYRG